MLAVGLLASLSPVQAEQPAALPAVTPTETSKLTARNPALPGGRSTSTSDYTVSPDDLLDVYVMDVPEVSRTYRVSSNGFLALPLLPNPIHAEGETLNQLSHLIAAKYKEAGMLNNAYVTVSLKETRQHTVIISGEVNHPQTYPILGETRLLDVLVQAGGLGNAAGDDATIIRGEIGARADQAEAARTGGVNPSANGTSFSVNIRKLVESGDEKNNIRLYPGDHVVVQRAALIYVMGAVVHPGGYMLNDAHQQMTVLKALAMAGDVSPSAKRTRILLLRRDPAKPGEAREEIPVNYKAIVKGQVADLRLKPDDILFVPESSSLKAVRTAVGSAVSVVTMAGPGLLIYH